ncbi:MAG: DMT family transporter [Thermacetogeniaceae bacterium]
MQRKGFFFLAVTIFFFSTYEVVSKTIGGAIDPIQLNFLRFFFGGLLLLPLALRDLKKRQLRLSLKNMLLLAMIGLFSVGLSMNLLQFGINLTKANLAAVIFSSNPLFVTLAASLWLRERLSLAKLSGILVGFIGVYLTFSGEVTVGSGFYTGIVLLVLSALTFGVITVAGKRITLSLGSLSMNACSFLFGSIALIPVLIWRHTPVFAFNASIWPQLLYLTVLVTAVAYYCYFVGLSMLDTSLGATVFFVKPLLASLLAAAVLGERLTAGLVFGMLLVLVSIYLVLRGAGLTNERSKGEERINKPIA